MKFVEPKVAKKPIYYSDKKAIVSGDVIEVVSYQNGNYYGFEGQATGKKIITKGEEKRSDNINATKKRIRRLINSNVTGRDSFLTLTYAENMKDVKRGKRDFKIFVKSMKRLGYEFGYVYVVEFQERGAVHFHVVMFNVPYIPIADLKRCWKHGTITINKINEVDNAGAYVVKYMNKEYVSTTLVGDLYGRSRGLKKPIEVNNPQTVGKLIEDNANHLVYTTSYTNEYKGTCVYCQFNKKR